MKHKAFSLRVVLLTLLASMVCLMGLTQMPSVFAVPEMGNLTVSGSWDPDDPMGYNIQVTSTAIPEDPIIQWEVRAPTNAEVIWYEELSGVRSWNWSFEPPEMGLYYVTAWDSDSMYTGSFEVKSKPISIEQYYTFTALSNGYKVGLTSGFKTALNKATPTAYGDWKPGSPLPAIPATYKGKPVTSLSGVFQNCTEIRNLDLTAWDVSNVTDASYMFQKCTNLQSVNMASWNSSNVSSLLCTFDQCTNLVSVDMSGWNTDNLTTLYYTFNGCHNLTTVKNYSTWNVSRVSNMTFVFNECRKLDTSGISNWNPTSCTNFRATFRQNYALNSVDLSNWSVPSNASFWDMFGECNNLTSIDMHTWSGQDFRANARTTYMFNMAGSAKRALKIRVGDASMVEFCKNPDNTPDHNRPMLGSYANVYVDAGSPQFYTFAPIDSGNSYRLKLTSYFKEALQKSRSYGGWNPGAALPDFPKSFNGKPVTSTKWMFSAWTSPTTLDLSAWNVSGLVELDDMFYNNDVLTSVNVRGWNLQSAKTLKNMFRSCDKLVSADLSGWKLPAAKDVSCLFYECPNLTTVGNWSSFGFTDSLTNLGWILFKCPKVTSVGDISSWNVSNVTNFKSAFNSSAISELNVSTWDTSSAVDMTFMFQNCTKLRQLDLSRWNTSKVTNMQSMFSGCSALTELNLTGWDTSKVTNSSYIFLDTFNLQKISVGSKVTSSILANLPAPSSKYITGADGKWYSKSTGKGYASKDIPGKTADSYNAYTWKTYYSTTFSEADSGDQLFLTAGFKKALQDNTPYMGWNPGDPLPAVPAGLYSLSGVFDGCSKIKSLDLSAWNVELVINATNMFRGCSELEVLNLENCSMNWLSRANGAFEGCSKLKTLIVSSGAPDLLLNALPAPDPKVIPGATGKWYSTTTNKGYAPADIPTNVADTYTAIPTDTTPTKPQLSATASGSALNPATWTASGAKLIASGAVSDSGVARYEYKVTYSNGSSSGWKPMVASNTETVNGETNVLEATLIPTAKGVYAVRAISNRDEASGEATFDLWLDTKAPDQTDFDLQPPKEGISLGNYVFIMTVKDAPEVVGGTGSSGVAAVRYVSADLNNDQLDPPEFSTEWVKGNTLTLTFKDPGEYTFQAKDNVGNISTITYTYEAIAAPVLEYKISPTDPNSIILTVTSIHESGLKAIEYYDEKNQTWTEVSTSSPATFVAEANGVYEFRAVDNLGTASTSIYVTISSMDDSAPVMEANAIPNEANQFGNVTIKLNSSDLNTDGTQGSGVIRIEWYDGSAWKTLVNKPQYDHVVTKNGTYRYHAVDASGKVSKEVSVQINTIDTVKPVINITGTQKDPSGSFVTISLGASDPATAVSGIASIQVWNGKEWSTVTNKASGTYNVTTNGTFKFRAVDNAGLISKEVSTTVNAFDTTPPTISSSVEYRGYYAIITVRAADNVALNSIEMYDSKSGSWFTVSTETKAEYTAVTNGDYKFRAVDRAGNVSAEEVVHIAGLKDATGPVQVIITGGREWTVSKDIIITANDNGVPVGHTGISDVKDYAVTTENVKPTQGWKTTNTFHVTKNGTYYIWVRDNVGWISSQAVTINTIDHTPPTSPKVVVNRTDNNENIDQKEWTNVDARMTANGAYALSGINRYEYKLGDLGKVTAMNPTQSETLQVMDPAGKPYPYTNVKEAQNVFAIDEIIYVRSVSNSGLTSQWVPFDLWYDSLQPDTTSYFTADTDWTNQPVEITFTAKDTPAVPNGSAMSDIWKVRFVRSESGLGVDGVSTEWVESNTITVAVKDSTVYYFEAMDHASNVKEFTYRVTNYDEVMPETWIQDPTHEAAIDMEPDYFLDRIWTNQNITLTLHSRDVVPPNPPSGVAFLTTPDGRTAVPNIGQNSTKEFTKNQLIDHNGTFRFASEDAAGNINEIDYRVWNIDKVAPTVEWTEDVRYYEGTSTIYINASDDLSGVDYIEMPDGTKVYADLPPLDQNYQPGDPTPKLFAKYEVNQNGSYTFTVVDRAGNFVTKTFEYQNLRHDYGVKENSFTLDGEPATYTDMTVRATLQNFDGPGQDVSVKVYYMEDGQRHLLTTDTVDIPRANDDGTPGEFNWKGIINFEDKTDITTLWIMVGEEFLHLDLDPSNNVRTLQIAEAPYNFTITSPFDQEFVYPGQMVSVPYTVTATGLGDTRTVPVTMTLGTSNMSRNFVYIGRDNPSVNGSMQVLVPYANNGKARNGGNPVDPAEELTLRIRVNWDDRMKEANPDDNEVAMQLFSQMADLALQVSGNDLSGTATLEPDSPQGSFMYPAKYDKYEVTFRARNPHENIVSVITAGQTFNQKANDFKYTLDLARGKSQQFTIVVQSAEGSESQTYTVVIKRGNDNIDVDVIAKTPNGQEFVGIPNDDGNYKINLPVNENDYELTIKMRDPNADVVTVDSVVVNDYIYTGDHTIAFNSSNTHGVLVISEDRTLQKNFNVVVTTKNSNPSIEIVNKSELNGNIYGLGGILKSTNFVPYGNDITSLEIAHRAGRTNGVVVQVKVTDLNVDQFLRGYMQLPGSDVMYEVHWNTFDGPTVMQVADIDYGYVYIDRTAIRSDINPAQDVFLYVSDYATDSEAETALFTAKDKITIGADITAPVIAGTPDENAGTAENPKGTVTLDVTDSYTGVRDVTYRVTTDNGHTWSEVKTTTANGIIDLADTYGDIVVEVTATDNIRNKSSLNISLKVTSPDVSVDGDVYVTTNRVADVTFINTRKHNADSIRQDILDTFG